MSESVVELNDVWFSRRRHPIIRGASWRIGTGVTALLGPNGSGKTTLIKCITGLYRANKGTIKIENRDILEGISAQRLLGYVPQNPTLPGLARVRDVVSYAAWLSEVPSRELDERVTRALEAMNVLDLSSRRIRSLSGGQRQRVALATGIVHEPMALILDEPTVGLDPSQRLKVREVIREIGATRAVILSTHLTEDVQHLATSVGVLVGGTIRYSGPPSELGSAVPGDSPDDAIGSPFERGYDQLMRTLGGQE